MTTADMIANEIKAFMESEDLPANHTIHVTGEILSRLLDSITGNHFGTNKCKIELTINDAKVVYTDMGIPGGNVKIFFEEGNGKLHRRIISV